MWSTCRAFLAQGAAQRLHQAQLPGYVPYLNPVEWLWNQLKRVQLGNGCCAQLSHLRDELRKAIERVRHRTDLITQFFHQPGYLQICVSSSVSPILLGRISY